MIRKFENNDLDIVSAIARRAWTNIYEGLRAQLGDEVFTVLYPDPVAIKAEQIRNHAEKHRDNFLVAERNDRIVGFITFYLDRNRRLGIIGNNAVDPICGEKGVGQEMYQAVFEHFRSEGILLVQVTTGLDEAHAPARRAYERAGFNLRTESVTYTMNLDVEGKK